MYYGSSGFTDYRQTTRKITDSPNKTGKNSRWTDTQHGPIFYECLSTWQYYFVRLVAMPSPFGGLYFTRRKSKLNSKFTFRVVLNWMPYFCLSYDNRHVDPHQVSKGQQRLQRDFAKYSRILTTTLAKLFLDVFGSSFYISYSIFLSFCQSYRFKVPGNHLTITQFTHPQHFLNVNWKSNEF